MNGQTSYPNPYATPNGVAGQPVPPTVQRPAAKPKQSIALAVVLLIVGLLIGGVAGYFAGDLLVFSAERTTLTQRIAALEQQVTTLQQTQTGTIPTGTGSGTAPTLSGITPDAQTSTWSVYNNPAFHISFKHPSDFEVREFQTREQLTSLELDPDEALFAAGIFGAGETSPAGMIVVYKTDANDGPDHRNLTLFAFPARLPTTVQTASAGAGQINKITERAVILNGTDAVELSASEGRGLEATPGGSIYKSYLIEDSFEQTYMATYCDSDQSTQSNIVGCLFLTTIDVI